MPAGGAAVKAHGERWPGYPGKAVKEACRPPPPLQPFLPYYGLPASHTQTRCGPHVCTHIPFYPRPPHSLLPPPSSPHLQLGLPGRPPPGPSVKQPGSARQVSWVRRESEVGTSARSLRSSPSSSSPVRPAHGRQTPLALSPLVLIVAWCPRPAGAVLLTHVSARGPQAGSCCSHVTCSAGLGEPHALAPPLRKALP